MWRSIFWVWWNGLEMICWSLWCAAAKIWSWYEMLLYRIGVVCGEICSWQERVWVLTCYALLYVAVCPWHLVQTLAKEKKQTKDIKQHKHMTTIFLGPASTTVETAMPCHFTNRYICQRCLPMCICLEWTHPSNAQLQTWVFYVAHTYIWQTNCSETTQDNSSFRPVTGCLNQVSELLCSKKVSIQKGTVYDIMMHVSQKHTAPKMLHMTCTLNLIIVLM